MAYTYTLTSVYASGRMHASGRIHASGRMRIHASGRAVYRHLDVYACIWLCIGVSFLLLIFPTFTQVSYFYRVCIFHWSFVPFIWDLYNLFEFHTFYKSFMPFSPKFNTSYSTFVTLMRVSHLFWVSDLLFEFCVFYSSFIHLFKLSTFY